MDLEAKIALIIEWAHDKKVNSLKSINVQDRCSFTEHLIICTCSATIHNKAVADYLIDKAKEHKIKILGKEGFEACTWILIDMNDVIVHLFTEETLPLYSLEDLWKMDTTTTSRL